MDTFAGVNGTWCDDVFFTEDAPPSAVPKGRVRVEISRQNANLTQVKRKLASQAQGCGGNSVIKFKYGQRAHRWWTHILDFKWDSESWYGEGEAAFLEGSKGTSS
jgi:hypothetical protein